MHKSLIIISLFLLPAFGFCQDTLEENFLEEQSENSEQSELLERLAELKQNPIDLNTADLPELELIPGLTPKLRQEILRYREKNGKFHSKTELLQIPGMTRETFLTVRDLIRVRGLQASHFLPEKLHWRTRVSERVDKPKGFADGTYESSSQKIYNRLKFTLQNKIAGGFLLEKDSGERRLDDLRLFYITLNFNEKFTTVLGNYQFEAGQGLVLWGPYGFSKSSETIFPIKKRGRGPRGYLTVDENAAFEGAVATFKMNSGSITSFASKSKLDGTLNPRGEVSNLFSSGFHRNEAETNKKDVLTETVIGGRLNYWGNNRFSVGATGYRASFDKIMNDPQWARNRFEFRGRENWVIGGDWNLYLNTAELFGELARSKSGGMALVAGAIVDLEPVHLAFLYRNYQKNFQNLHGFGFGEANGATQNEKGYYTGLEFRITNTTILSAYYDIFSFPWRTFFEPLPVSGNEFMSQIKQRWGKIYLTLRFRQKIKTQTETFNDALNRQQEEFVENKHIQLRLQLDYQLSKHLFLRNRIELIQLKQKRFNVDYPHLKECGFLLYQDIRVRPFDKLELSGRLAFFETDSFFSRVFQYEYDLPGVLTNRALFGRGSRWYFLLKYQPLPHTFFYAKYSETYRDDTDVIGTGAEEILGNLDRRLAVQLELKF